MKITLLVSDRCSWIMPYVNKLEKILKRVHKTKLVFDVAEIENGDLLFLISQKSPDTRAIFLEIS